METLSDTQAIFQQLSTLEPCGVKTIIENYDAADNVPEFGLAFPVALRARLCRDAAREARIEAQRRILLPLVTQLRRPIASAG